MGFATSNQTAVRFVEEVTFGDTPPTPVFQELRYTGESLNHNIETVTSNEIRADRMTSDLVQVGAMNEGDISIEMSYGSYDSFIEGAMASNWGAGIDVSDTTIEVDSSNSINSGGSPSLAGPTPGSWVQIQGFANDANNGIFQVETADASSITFVQNTFVVESAGGTVRVNGSTIRNGVTPLSYTLQKFLSDATVPTYINYTGCRVGTWDLSFDTAAILTGSFGFMGTVSDAGDTPITGQTVTPATTTDVLNSVNNVAEVIIDGVPTDYYFSQLSLSINNNLRAQSAIGYLPAVNIALSRLSVSGSITFYFEDASQYNKYVNGERLSISFLVEDAAGDAYMFTLPAVEFSSGSITAGSLDTDVFMEAEFEAVMDPVTASMIQVDRFAAA